MNTISPATVSQSRQIAAGATQHRPILIYCSAYVPAYLSVHIIQNIKTKKMLIGGDLAHIL